MAIQTDQLQEIRGFDKEIEHSALGMILDNLQVSQYQYPQKSTVRELVSNALDAVKEKQIALSILRGESKVEDHFITRQEELYKDSNFNPAYYDTKWLATGQQGLNDPNTVYVTYTDGGERDKDKLLIEDYGVGLGGKRLEGYFRLGYSTKRNTKSALGKFGIGAKAALSTAPYYTMTTRYNGREYSFQIYSRKIVSVVPQFDLETGKANGVHLFNAGTDNETIVYYRDTTASNGTVIEVEAKKHHKTLYMDAVKSQLLYFDNVEFRVRNSNGGIDVIPIKANIIYEDDHIIMSDNNQYSKPHLLISKVNYGYVDFKELELEDKMGNIGIKVAAEDVSVNPSRESVIWNETTRETVIKAFNTVVGIAEKMISSQLIATDFIEWLQSCAAVAYKYSNSQSVIGRLAKIVDISGAKVAYSPDPEIKFEYPFLTNLDVRTVRLTEKREGSTIKYRIQREVCGMAELGSGLPIIVQSTRSMFLKDKYILTELYKDGFIAIRLRQTTMEEGGDLDVADWTTDQLETLNHSAADLRIPLAVLKERLQRAEQYITQSEHITPYDAIVVPESFDGKEEVVIEEEKVEKEKDISWKERRKLQGTMPVYTLRVTENPYNRNAGNNERRIYDWQKLELPVADIDTWDDEEVFYATDKVIDTDNGVDVLESSLLHLAAVITRPYQNLQAPVSCKPELPSKVYGIYPSVMESCTHFFNPAKKIKLIKIAQERRKYFTDFKPIQRFFLDIKNKTLTMSNALIRWNTARILHSHFEKLRFLENFELFHYQHCITYRNLKRYITENYRDVEGLAKTHTYYGVKDSGYSDLINHCDKVLRLQLIVKDHKDEPELIAAAVKELFGAGEEVTDGCAVDMGLYTKMMELLEYAAPVYTLLNEIYALTWVGKDSGEHKEISETLEHDIKEYLEFKGVALN